MSIARFVADGSLGGLARRARLLGYDIVAEPGATLEDACRLARREDRIVLTHSRRVPPACAFASRLIVEPGREPEAIAALARRGEPDGPPFSRCAECNVPLEPVRDPTAAPAPPPADVEVTGQCPACRRCYWIGSHVERLRAWFAAALADESPRAATER